MYPASENALPSLWIDLVPIKIPRNADPEAPKVDVDTIDNALDNPVYPIYEDQDVGEPRYEDLNTDDDSVEEGLDNPEEDVGEPQYEEITQHVAQRGGKHKQS